jgi:hypothetical protein
MNIFVLDTDPVVAAEYNCDKHVVKMVLELYQQLGSAVIRHGAKPEEMPVTSKGTPLKGGYHHHPCTRWVGDAQHNYKWACEHAIGLCNEYTKRYGKKHSCELGIRQLATMDNKIPNGELTPFALAMPDEYKVSDAVESYRNYYRGDKKAFAKWKLGNVPAWWIT